jgi:WD40 repeat protein
VNSVAYSPDGKHIVSGSTNFTVKLWDAQTGEEVSIRVEVMVMIGGCARRG